MPWQRVGKLICSYFIVIYVRSDVVSRSAVPAKGRREDFTIMFHLLGS